MSRVWPLLVAGCCLVGVGLGYFCAPLALKYQVTATQPWLGSFTFYRNIENLFSSVAAFDRFVSSTRKSSPPFSDYAISVFRDQLMQGQSSPLTIEREFSTRRNDVLGLPEAAARELKDVTSVIEAQATSRNRDLAGQLVALGQEFVRETSCRTELFFYLHELNRGASIGVTEAETELARSNVEAMLSERRLQDMKTVNVDATGLRSGGPLASELINVDEKTSRFLSPSRQLLALEVEVIQVSNKLRQEQIKLARFKFEKSIADRLLTLEAGDESSAGLMKMAREILDKSAPADLSQETQSAINLGRANIKNEFTKIETRYPLRPIDASVVSVGMSGLLLAGIGGLVGLLLGVFIAAGPRRAANGVKLAVSKLV